MRIQSLELNFPISAVLINQKEVGTILMEALPGTLLLALAAMIIAVLTGIPLGVIAAVKQNTLARYLPPFL